MLNIKSLVPRISVQTFTKTLFFDSVTVKTAAEIGESVGTGDYPGFDRNWDHWCQSSNPNASKLSDHEKSNVDEIHITTRHHITTVQKLEELMEQFEGVESDDVKTVGRSVNTDLQYLDVSVIYTKNMIDDYGQIILVEDYLNSYTDIN
jgi:hypothetical protein